jgi:protein-L-isoaspartate(D-aspartate) O-methyltransferase
MRRGNPNAETTEDEAAYAKRRTEMVARQLRANGILDERVLDAMRRVPRHRFVPLAERQFAYTHQALPIPDDQTISQPYIVALMTQAASLVGGEKVLEIGTGSGYQTAVLSEMGVNVWSIERHPALHREAASRLTALGFRGIHLRCGDGTAGWPEEAPFDRILATGSLPAVPEALTSQLRPGGVFVGPTGTLHDQLLVRIEYDRAGPIRRVLCACRFVPLIGRYGWTDEEVDPFQEAS